VGKKGKYFDDLCILESSWVSYKMKVIIGKEVIITNSHVFVSYIIINWGKVKCTIQNLGHMAWGETMIR
jgi:hypothetical protein